MLSQSNDLPIVEFSLSVYRILLAAYPKAFRLEYGSAMQQVFRDCCLHAYGTQGLGGMFRLWAVTLFDLIRSVIEEHLQKETNMSKSTFIRISGWSLILGGLAYLLVFINAYLEETQDILYQLSPFRDISQISAFYFGPILLGFGMLGLRARYGDSVGEAGKSALLIGAVGAVVSYLGLFNFQGPDLWLLIYLGPAISLACLTFFGVLTIRHKTLPRWNWLPIVAGVWFPLALLLYLFNIIGDSAISPIYVLVLIQFPALMVLGFILQGDKRPLEKMPVTA